MRTVFVFADSMRSSRALRSTAAGGKTRASGHIPGTRFAQSRRMTETLASPAQQLSQETIDFYCKAMETLQQAGIPFLVGGAYAYARYTGVIRHTKDFDVFIRPEDFERALEALAGSGCQVERNFPHWLGK